jgi:hypothetical protein
MAERTRDDVIREAGLTTEQQKLVQDWFAKRQRRPSVWTEPPPTPRSRYCEPCMTWVPVNETECRACGAPTRTQD